MLITVQGTSINVVVWVYFVLISQPARLKGVDKVTEGMTSANIQWVHNRGT